MKRCLNEERSGSMLMNKKENKGIILQILWVESGARAVRRRSVCEMKSL